VIFPTLAKWQPYLFGFGVAGLSLFMMGAGTLGVARRHWDITFSDATLTFAYSPTAFLMMALNGMSGILAAVGGFSFVIIVVGSVLFGRRRDDAYAKAHPVVSLGGGVIGHYGSEPTFKLPGTLTLVGFFFLAFVLYYFVNWKYLANVWPLS